MSGFKMNYEEIKEKEKTTSTCGICSTFDKPFFIYQKLVDFKEDGMWKREWKYFDDEKCTKPHKHIRKLTEKEQEMGLI